MKSITPKATLKRVSIAFVIITIILASLEYVLLVDYNNNIESHNSEVILHYTEQYNTIISGYRLIAQTYFDELVNSEDVLSIVNNANYSNSEEKKILRKQLNDKLHKLYDRAKQNEFRQFHFVLKDCESFLRMHKKDFYGDNLRNIRNTIRIVNDEKKYVEGFEEGKIFNGYRFEYPLFYNNKYIGCVETSISFVAIIKFMDNLFDNPCTFIIKKDIVESKVQKEQISINYAGSLISSNYYYDKEGYDHISKNEDYRSLISKLIENAKIVNNMDSLLNKDKNFIINIEKDKQIYSMVFLNIQNVIGEPVGYLIFYDENRILAHLRNSMIIKTCFVVMIWILLILISFVIYKSRIKMNQITYFDKLTGVYNRNKLYAAIEQEMEYNKNFDKPFSMIIYDIDHFKKINDKNGHMIGDCILKETIDVVKNNIDSSDYIFRFGGDEFIILLPNKDCYQAENLAKIIRKHISIGRYCGNKVEHITFSMGVAQYDGNETLENYIYRTDAALYKAKQLGRNQVYLDTDDKEIRA